MSTKKLTGTENLTQNTFCVGPVGPTDKENHLKMYKKYPLGTLQSLFETVRIRICIKQSDQIEKQDPEPDSYQIEKQDPDQYQKGLDPQH